MDSVCVYIHTYRHAEYQGGILCFFGGVFCSRGGGEGFGLRNI